MVMATKAIVFTYTPVLFGERSAIGMVFSIICENPIFSRKEAMSEKPP